MSDHEPLVVPPLPDPRRLPGGGWSSVPGTMAGVAAADVKGNGKHRSDVAVLVAPGVAAGVSTVSTAAAAPNRWSRARLPGPVHAIVVNSGNANASTGAQGEADTAEMAAIAAETLGCDPDQVLVASTGVIGVPMPMDRVRGGIRAAGSRLHADSEQLARALMTTDLRPKHSAVRLNGLTVGGVAKGSGMIHPGMATMLGFMATDAAVDAVDLQQLVGAIADRTFNAISVDGDMSTNDLFVVQATGRGEPIRPGDERWRTLEVALEVVATDLARAIARDGEGATTLIECVVMGTDSDATARRGARAVTASSLVKAAVHGRDANWGRVVGALGAAGIPDLHRCDVDLAGIPVLRAGAPVRFDEAAATAALRATDVTIACRLPGTGLGRAWGCDLSAEYVAINADYRS
jgi:glutamate N-acetyltransferase/amino-acid N-acetyltransferase